MVKKRKSGVRSIKSRKLRGRVTRSLAKTTKGGVGRINKRSSYKRVMK